MFVFAKKLVDIYSLPSVSQNIHGIHGTFWRIGSMSYFIFGVRSVWLNNTVDDTMET